MLFFFNNSLFFIPAINFWPEPLLVAIDKRSFRVLGVSGMSVRGLGIFILLVRDDLNLTF